MKLDTNFTIISDSPEMTRRIGASLADALCPADVIGLIGDLGTGKTVLVQGISRALRITEEATSPTFILMNILKGRIRLVHVDLYRLDKTSAHDLGLHDYLADSAIVIEWADRLTDLPADLVIKLNYVSEKQCARELVFQALSHRGNKLLQAIELIGV